MSLIGWSSPKYLHLGAPDHGQPFGCFGVARGFLGGDEAVFRQRRHELVHPSAVVARWDAIARLEADFAQVAQVILIAGEARWALLEVREVKNVVLQLHVATRGEVERVADRLGADRLEERAHFLGALQIVRIIVEAHAVGVAERGAGLHAEQEIVWDGVLAAHVVCVVGGDHRDAQLARQLEQQPVQLGELW